MTEAWKSVPKKFCELCKCWFYDNKVSVQHHEQGRRHQESVQQKLRDLGKKGRERDHEQREKITALVQMERAALSAYKRDLKDDPNSAAAYNIHLNLAALPIKAAPSIGKRPRFEDLPSGDAPFTSASASTSTSTSNVSIPIWYETRTEDDGSGTGATYFWNIQTGETTWQLPEGVTCITLAEQEFPSSQATTEIKKEIPEAEDKGIRVKEEIGEKPIGKGGKGEGKPIGKGGKDVKAKNVGKKAYSGTKKETGDDSARRKFHVEREKVQEKEESTSDTSATDEEDTFDSKKPYGDWQPVEVEKSRKDEFAYLPHNQWIKDEGNNAGGDASAEEVEPKVKITFGERTAPSLGASAAAAAAISSTFKKRKAPAGGRNIRNRDD